jgi:hypothetical protein
MNKLFDKVDNLDTIKNLNKIGNRVKMPHYDHDISSKDIHNTNDVNYDIMMIGISLLSLRTVSKAKRNSKSSTKY